MHRDAKEKYESQSRGESDWSEPQPQELRSSRRPPSPLSPGLCTTRKKGSRHMRARAGVCVCVCVGVVLGAFLGSGVF